MTHQVTKLPPDGLWGLTYRPTIEPVLSDDAETIVPRSAPQDFSSHNRLALERCLAELGRRCRCIVEIGVSISPTTSSATSLLITRKPTSAYYLGVDVEDRHRLNSPDDRVYVLQVDSRNTTPVLAAIRDFGQSHIDLLYLDGGRSVNVTLSDWGNYARLVAARGYVLVHDSNTAPEPSLLYDAVDDGLFEKRRLFSGDADDHGLSVYRRRPIVTNAARRMGETDLAIVLPVELFG